MLPSQIARDLSGDMESSQLILESMVVMLQTIEQTYGDYITIETIYHKGG